MKVCPAGGSLALVPPIRAAIADDAGTHRVARTVAPQEATRAIARDRPDVVVVVVEVRGPASCGLRVIRALRVLRDRPWLVVVADDASPAACGSCAGAGADFVFDRLC
ncbi:MAG: hypothetical protein U1F10_09785 [Burkholderiales bacterium]